MARHGGRSKRSYYRMFTHCSQVVGKRWKPLVGSIAPPQTENTSYAVVVRKLKVNWSDLEIACESNGAEHSYYLDLETGEVLMVMHDLRQEVEQLRDRLLQTVKTFTLGEPQNDDITVVVARHR